jgi:hypothetical protein
MAESMLLGWKQIAEGTPFSANAFRLRYGKEMLSLGYVFKSHIGRCKRPAVWTFPILVKAYFALKQQKQGKI